MKWSFYKVNAYDYFLSLLKNKQTNKQAFQSTQTLAQRCISGSDTSPTALSLVLPLSPGEQYFLWAAPMTRVFIMLNLAVLWCAAPPSGLHWWGEGGQGGGVTGGGKLHCNEEVSPLVTPVEKVAVQRSLETTQSHFTCQGRASLPLLLVSWSPRSFSCRPVTKTTAQRSRFFLH